MVKANHALSNSAQVESNRNTPDNILNSLGNSVEQRFFSLPKRRTMRDDRDSGFKYRKIIIYLVLRARGLFISITGGVGRIIRDIIGLFKRGGGGAYLILLNIALTLSLIDLVVKNEGGGEGLNNFLLLKKGGLCLLKRGIIERGPL